MPYLKSAPPNKDNCKIFWRNKNVYIWYQKCLILTFFTKNAWFGYFWGRIKKNYCYSWNQHPEILLIAKFYEKTKISKIGNKNALFRYICSRILKNVLFGYFWVRILKILSSYLKSAPSNFAKKQKYLNLGWKCLICVFLGKNLKKLLSYLKLATTI